MKVVVAMALIAAGPAFADCPYPPAPSKLPDGATATMPEMLEGQKTVKEYEKAINEYTTCIDKELDDAVAKAGDQLKPERKTEMQRMEAQKHNAAVDQLQTVADRFNEQVKVFKAKQADKK
jgi:DNA uptake protein ComE-like DNA-binding protein